MSIQESAGVVSYPESELQWLVNLLNLRLVPINLLFLLSSQIVSFEK